MAEPLPITPTEGEGSLSPDKMPQDHTPVGMGGTNVDAKGVAGTGRPPLPGGGGAIPPIGGGGGGGVPPAAKGPAAPMPVKTPEQLLDERSEKRLEQDIKDILILEKLEDSEDIISLEDLGLDILIRKLVDEKGWRVDRLKELLPSRDEKGIIQYFQDLLEGRKKSDTTSDVNQKPLTPPMPMPSAPSMAKAPIGGQASAPATPKNAPVQMQPMHAPNIQPQMQSPKAASIGKTNSVRSTYIMSKEEILVNSGKLESVTNITDSLNQLSYAIDSASQARKAYADAVIKKAGLDSLGMGLGLGKGMEEEMPETDPLAMGSKEGDLKDALKMLTDVLKKFLDERGSSKLDADSAIKSDAMIGKAKDEIGKGKDMLSGIGKPKEEKKEEGLKPFEKKEEKEEKEEPVEEKAEKMAMDAAAGGKKVNVSSAQAGEPEQGKGEGGDPMKATMGKKEAKEEILEKIKERMTKLAEARKANLYPFKQPKEYQFSDINAEMAGKQKTEIDSDMKSGEMTKDKKEKFLGQGREKGGNQPKDPGMEISKPANKAAEEQMITIKQANTKTAQEVEEAVAKIKLAMEVASVQQLKDLISNPLKEAMVKNMVEAGIVKEAAEAIAHNSFLDGYQKAQEEVISEAFNHLAKQNIDEFIKVASFTKKYSGEFNASVKEAEETKPQVKTASEKGSVALRGSQVTKQSDTTYRDFWRNAYAEQRSGK